MGIAQLILSQEVYYHFALALTVFLMLSVIILLVHVLGYHYPVFLSVLENLKAPYFQTLCCGFQLSPAFAGAKGRMTNEKQVNV